MSDVVKIGLEVHFGLQIWVQKVVNKGAAFCFKLLSFFEDSGASGRPNWSISLIFHWFYCYLVDTEFGHAGAARPAILGARICFKLLCFFDIWVSARRDFDSGGGFKGKVGGEDDVVGKVRNDEFSGMLKCFNSLSEIEYLRVLGCLLGWLG